MEKEIPDDVIEYIASNMGSDVRQLEGSVTRLIAYSTIMGGANITVDLAIEALKDYINKGISEKNDIHKIQKVVSEYFQITVEDIKSKKEVQILHSQDKLQCICVELLQMNHFLRLEQNLVEKIILL